VKKVIHGFTGPLENISRNQKGFEILSYSVDDNREAVHRFRKERYAMPWLHAIDPQLRAIHDNVAKQFEVVGLPNAFLVDASGKILATRYEMLGEQLEKKLAEILGGPANR
jgi:hypothetical protein